MEIYFCEKCSARLSTPDIQRGDAVVYQGEVYCYHCVPEGVDPDALPKPKRKGSAFNIPVVRPKLGARAGGSGSKRRPGSNTRMAATKPRPGSNTRTPAIKAGAGSAAGTKPSGRQTPGGTRARRAPSSSRNRPASSRLRPETGPSIILSPKGVILVAAVLGVVFATAAFFAMRMLG